MLESYCAILCKSSVVSFINCSGKGIYKRRNRSCLNSRRASRGGVNRGEVILRLRVRDGVCGSSLRLGRPLFVLNVTRLVVVVNVVSIHGCEPHLKLDFFAII